MSIKLSIIIPCYNAEPYINELLDCLDKQVTKDVEVIVIDDGSKKPFLPDYEWVQLIRQENAGASAARNKGLDVAKGQYVAFIDADDLVAENYITTILEKIKAEKFDYCYMSWKTMPGGWNCDVKLRHIEDKFPAFNLCVWNRIYRRSMIGKVRFNTKKLVAEDAQFIREVKEEGRKKAFISEYMYYYRSQTPDSLTKRFHEGKLDTERVVYHFKHVTPDMTYLIDEFKETDKRAEVILMANRNDIPELEKYAMVIQPTRMVGTEFHGEHTPLFRKLEKPFKTQVLVYVSAEQAIGGIETFVYNFCVHMHKYYDIAVLYDAQMDIDQMARLLEYVPVIKNSATMPIHCDTFINCRVVTEIPKNVSYNRSIQMSHTCQMNQWRMPQDKDVKVFVSEKAAKTFHEKEGDYEVIHNLTLPQKCDKPLILVSATRLTEEKGAKRMVKFAEGMRNAGIDFLWLYFTYTPINDAIPGMIHMQPTLDITKYFKLADYVVQLSDVEAFCYTIVEALEMQVPVIATPLDVLTELGFNENKNGYVVPFDVDGFDFAKLKDIPKFEYTYDNAKIIKQWRNLLGDSKPKHDYKPKKEVNVKVIKEYKDIQRNELMKPGTMCVMKYARALDLESVGFVRIIE